MRIPEKVLTFLFKDYKNRLDENYRLEKRAFEAGVDIKDIVRERLKGVRVVHPDKRSWLMDTIAQMERPERLDFLSKAHSAGENKALTTVIDFLLTESQSKSALDARDMVEVNFNRATANGLMLLEEQIAVLSQMYTEEKKREELMPPEERFNSI